MSSYKPDTLIPVYEPYKARNQRKYVLDCVDTNWISSRGDYIDRFEKAIGDFIGVPHVITTFNGSVSLMLILTALGIGPGDEVITPSLTYAATVSNINWVGATAVLCDSDSQFQMNLDDLKKYVTSKTKAIMVPQLYGDSPDMERLMNFCLGENIALVEDSAEVFGCSFPVINAASPGVWPPQEGFPTKSRINRMLGSFGVASSFSFFGNKTITTGEGGCVCTWSDELAKKMRLLKSQSHIGGFVHNGPGYNFRMTNIQAAIGLAQLEDINKILSKKKNIAEYYRNNLDPSIGCVIPKVNSAEWMPLFTLPSTINYIKFQDLLKQKLVDSRPAFTPVHLMSGFNISTPEPLTKAEEIYKKGFNLPSYPDLTKKQLKYIVGSVNEVVSTIR